MKPRFLTLSREMIDLATEIFIVDEKKQLEKLDTKKCNNSNKVGPVLVINGVITSISRVITPVTQLFSAIYRGPITPFITSRGPP